MFGFLNVYKPKGKTSHDIVAILRRLTKIKQIGHTGTLDPFAEGVLPICIGKSTRLIEYINDDKAYIGTVQFGKATTTYDLEGECTKTSDKQISLEEIENALTNFKGEIEQTPPIFSAIKVNGKKLYEYARKGEKIEVQPRKVTISNLKITRFDFEKQTVELYIECSKGTYIRSIANDLGENLGVYGHLIKLVRVKAGDFVIENSVQLEALETIENIKENLIYPTKYLHYPVYELSDYEFEKISHGNSININTNNGLTVLAYKNALCAIGNVSEKLFKCSKVFI